MIDLLHTPEEYDVRTNIVLDDKLMSQAKRLGRHSTKRQVVEEALKLYVRMKRQEEVRRWRGKLRWEGDLDAMRRD